VHERRNIPTNILIHEDIVIYGNTLIYWFSCDNYKYLKLYYLSGDIEVVRTATEDEYKDLCYRFNKLIRGMYG
jgi:hypothetical protein